MMIKGELWKLYLMMVFAMVTWGLSWTNAKILGFYADIPLIIFWRFVIAALCFFFIAKNRVSLHLSNENILTVLINSICMVSYNFFYFKGTQVGLAGTGAVLVTTMNPILTVIFSSLFFQEAIPKKRILGLFLGFLAGSIILRIWEMNILSFYNSGNLFLILASFSWVAITIITSRTKNKIPFLSYSFWTFTLSILVSLPLVPINNLLLIFNFDMTFWVNLISLSVFAMALGTSIYFYASTELGPGRASSFIFLVPFTAILSSMYFLREPLQISTVLGGIIGIFSVYLINVN